jgi:hypothetical protein
LNQVNILAIVYEIHWLLTMKTSKLFFLASPLLLTSVVAIAHPAQASIFKSNPTNQLGSTAIQAAPSVEKSTIRQQNQQSNPIIDNLGCGCAVCVKAKLQMESKFKLENML